MSFRRFVIQNINKFEFQTKIKFAHLQIFFNHLIDQFGRTGGAFFFHNEFWNYPKLPYSNSKCRCSATGIKNEKSAKFFFRSAKLILFTHLQSISKHYLKENWSILGIF